MEGITPEMALKIEEAKKAIKPPISCSGGTPVVILVKPGSGLRFEARSSNVVIVNTGG